MMDLVIAASMGDETAKAALWEQVKRLAAFIIGKYRGFYQHGAIDFDDLMQESYICFLAAVKNYRADTGNEFSTYYGTCLHGCIKRALGIGERDSGEYTTVSFDTPLSDEGDATLLDTIADDSAPTEDDIVKALSETIDVQKALQKLPAIESAVLWHVFHNEMTCEQAGAQLGLTAKEVLRIKRLALNHLRKDREFRMKCSDYTSNTGFCFFRDTWTSAVEHIVLQHERYGL